MVLSIDYQIPLLFLQIKIPFSWISLCAPACALSSYVLQHVHYQVMWSSMCITKLCAPACALSSYVLQHVHYQVMWSSICIIKLCAPAYALSSVGFSRLCGPIYYVQLFFSEIKGATYCSWNNLLIAFAIA